MTKNLSPRDIWIPGKSFKDLNNWWMLVVDDITREIPWWSMGQTSLEVLQHSKTKMGFMAHQFDISAFGIQYPREYLIYMLECIQAKYPSDLMDEMVKLATSRLKSISVHTEGRFTSPPRGIGLGYLENLKAMGIASLIYDATPISFFGDQGLVKYLKDQEIFKKAGFLFNEREYRDKVFGSMGSVKWAGGTLSSNYHKEADLLWSDILGAFDGEYHWERKSALAGLSIPAEHESIWEHLPFAYEKAFGYEFYPGESLGHPTNLGVNKRATLVQGKLKDWKVTELDLPGHRLADNYLYESQWSKPYCASDAKKFSRLRKKTWKRSKPFDTQIIHFARPVLQNNKTLTPKLGKLARSIPSWMELRLLLYHNTVSGGILNGLSFDRAFNSAAKWRYAKDPLRTEATGGYKIITPWIGSRGPSEEIQELIGCLLGANPAEEMRVYRNDVQRRRPEAIWNPNLSLTYEEDYALSRRLGLLKRDTEGLAEGPARVVDINRVEAQMIQNPFGVNVNSDWEETPEEPDVSHINVQELNLDAADLLEQEVMLDFFLEGDVDQEAYASDQDRYEAENAAFLDEVEERSDDGF